MAILPQMYSLAAIYGQNTAIETYFAANIDDTTGLVYDLIWMSFTWRNRDKIEAKSHFAVYRRFRDQIKKKTPGQGLFGLIIFAVTCLNKDQTSMNFEIWDVADENLAVP